MPDQIDAVDTALLPQFVNPVGDPFGQPFDVLPWREVDRVQVAETAQPQAKTDPAPDRAVVKQPVQQQHRGAFGVGPLAGREPAERQQQKVAANGKVFADKQAAAKPHP